MKKLKKIINFDGIESYYCSKHKCFHFRFRNGKKAKPFFNCQETAFILTKSESFKRSFQKKWFNHAKSKEYKSHLIN